MSPPKESRFVALRRTLRHPQNDAWLTARGLGREVCDVFGVTDEHGMLSEDAYANIGSAMIDAFKAARILP